MPDVNVLLYAHRPDLLGHTHYREWMEKLVAQDEPFALSVLVAVGFVRIATNRRAFPQPTPLPQALAVIDTLAGCSNCRLVAPGPRHWPLVKRLAESARSTGKGVADAQHGAVAIEHGCEWVTRDGDFAAFEPQGLRWRHLVF